MDLTFQFIAQCFSNWATKVHPISANPSADRTLYVSRRPLTAHARDKGGGGVIDYHALHVLIAHTNWQGAPASPPDTLFSTACREEQAEKTGGDGKCV